ncbi:MULTISPECIES: crossover junction endodeoxyribonuclease RuvC [Pseudothermotoga]|uniref:Crossover junction endodeoxyribonuclease RuvC n=1 Tax=Pseudothermotoga lettingae (strain ATCC BAA-301 / DSM 14385 / NBRC 107922 / TMO) TaxID=416591 RepID=RUVC_PSELT|nr:MULTISPECIES: crossover junction endodeoxyribonuclease RuvC [Pseudothermotoga]A8F3S6.1 RecName: Full=Crossover junction endodeoxyribonuclease RuvC; AltName: Full=Holliday junction nuclease RuvC; AltName: Full=Holliday junction resolvase RuvC [Pseudothermotoga lettingae TMO]ABV32810.1 crossover junction endodeoxyribonuclease RuvC [Pseudothermotoga lettingae TMO]KUK21517.1 MAG: Crossover junction endodeoxyribonuclease RuvC [Pseudothermotoga lettingae]MDI3495135.1 crossover junction endodeoxyri
MIIFGVDPGFGILGYGVLSVSGNSFQHVSHGTIQTEKQQNIALRLKVLYEELSNVIDNFKPSEIAMEKLFFSRNITTAISVGEARGIVLLLAAQRNIPVFEYTPHEIKKAVTGSGKASKKDVQQMIKILLNLKELPKPDDAADGLAIAWCHCAVRNITRRFS